MTLSEAQRNVLLAVGFSPGTNAFSIAKELDRHQSGINRICSALTEQGLISTTKGVNIKRAKVNELRLTLMGFAVAVNALYHEHQDGDQAQSLPDYKDKIALFLRNNQDLHEGIGIFSEYFFFATEGDDTLLKIHRALYPLQNSMGGWVRFFDAMVRRGEDLNKIPWDTSIHETLYSSLFFELWDHLAYFEYHGEKNLFYDEVAPRFKNSSGWNLISGELTRREIECNRVRTLRSLIQ